jgi:gliding motility-associated-like protein
VKKIGLSVAVLFAISVCNTADAQDFSNKGKDFWVIYTGHIDGTTSRMALYITSDQNATGTVSVAGNSINFTVTANQVTTVRLTNSSIPPNSIAYNGQTTGIGTNKGIHIVSDNAVVVYSHILNSARSGSTLVLPTNVLGREYYVSTYKSVTGGGGNTRRSEFALAATQDNTTVEITPIVADANNTYAANTSFQVTLNTGDVFQYQSANDADLTGTYIKSIATATSPCKPIAVFAGSTWTAMGCASASSGDNLYQQLFPLASWGKEYITSPFILRSYDVFRVLVKDPTTVVQVNGVTVSAATLINNTYYEFNTIGNNTSRIITSDKPICVVQYMITQNCDGVNSDPEMIILNSVEQTLKDITVLSARNDLTPPNTNITRHFLNIVVKSSALSSLRIDGAPYLSTPVSIAATQYSYLQEEVTASTAINPSHRITCDSGFLAIAYGYGNVESYGYNAGTNVRDLYQFVSVQNQYATVNFPAACKSSPFYFSMTFPYQPAQIIWDFNGLFPNVTINNPVYDSTWTVNGKQLYLYRLPTPYTINTIGTYPIKVFAQNPTPDGCSGQQQIDYDLQVFAPPVADFTFTNNGCVTNVVSFTDNSNTGGRSVISRYWNFGDAVTANSNNPAHTYTAPGSCTVQYALITDVGCLSDTTTHVVNLSDPPTALFSVSSPKCQNKVITFSDLSTVTGGGVLSKWYWDFGDATPPVIVSGNMDQTHTYATTGTYNVTLKVETTTGCQSTVYLLPVIVSANPVSGFTFPNICLPAGTAQFTNTASISDGTQALFTYSWNFGDGTPTVNTQSPVHNFTTTGPYNVTLTVTSNNGCIDSSVQSVNTIYSQADGEFTVNAENCMGDVTSFTSTSNPLPGNTIAGWHWDFGDAVNSVLQNPTHIYPAPGTYTIRHWIVTDKGCNSDTAIHTVTINAQPTGNFTYTIPSCETKTISFTDVSAANSGTLNSWSWDFGDPSSGAANTSSLINPTHTYATAGPYSVSLVVTTTKGCVSGVSARGITINPQPHPGFISPEVCLSDAFAVFIDSTHIASGAISNWLWDFGDPGSGPLNTSSLQNPQHRYSAIGNYTASLTVTSNNGCVSSITQSFTVNGDIPVANFNAVNPVSLCANDSVAIQDASTVNFGNITKVEIYWDNTGAPTVFQTDDLPTPGKIYRHLYPNFQAPLTKTYTIRYRAYSGLTCINDRIKTIVVNAAPKVQFTILPDICLDAAPYLVTQASEIGSVPGSGIYSGPGITAGGVFTPSNVGPGIYWIKYTYTSATGGCVDTLSKTIKVFEPPVANFGFVGPACETQAVTFNDNSATVEGTLTTWTWDFADGTAMIIRNTGTSFTHTFAAYGIYAVKLRVTTSNGCVSVIKQVNVTVSPLPRPNFTIPVSACLPNANVTFNNLSAIADGSQSSFTYLWNFGDPPSGTVNSSTGINPSHTYISTGPFNINLQATSGAGCVHDTMIVLNTVHPQPLASFTADKTEVCVGDNFIFTDNSNPLDGTTTQWNWVMDDGNVRNTSTFNYTYGAAGTYNVSLFTFNDHGCRSTTYTSPVTVHPYPVVDAGPDRFVLEGGTITLEPTVTGNDLNYLWTPNLYFAGSNVVKNPVVKGVDDQTYLLTVTARGGCKRSDDVFVKVLKTPVIPNIFSPNGDGIHDTWMIEYLESYPGCIVQIYNRYGQMVQRFVNYASPWDGKINGKDAPIGTYYYIIDPKNGRKPITGFVDIIR